jgi:hypothetical protein
MSIVHTFGGEQATMTTTDKILNALRGGEITIAQALEQLGLAGHDVPALMPPVKGKVKTLIGERMTEEELCRATAEVR